MIQKSLKVLALGALFSSAAAIAQMDGGASGNTGISGVSGISGGTGIDFAAGSASGSESNNSDTGGLASSVENAFKGEVTVECRNPGEDC